MWCVGYIVQFSARAEALVEQVLPMQCADGGPIPIEPVRLEILRCQIVIPGKPQPLQIAHDLAGGAGRCTCSVEILDPKNDFATKRAHLQPRQKKRARIADMEMAGWAWCQPTPGAAVLLNMC